MTFFVDLPSWILPKLFDEVVDTLHLGGNVDALRTMADTLAAADTVAGLTKARHTAVISDEKCPSRPLIIGALRR